MTTICNQCGKEKEGCTTGFCSHCGKFGKTESQLKELDDEEKDIILGCLKQAYDCNQISEVMWNSIKEKLK